MKNVQQNERKMTEWKRKRKIQLNDFGKITEEILFCMIEEGWENDGKKKKWKKNERKVRTKYFILILIRWRAWSYYNQELR